MAEAASAQQAASATAEDTSQQRAGRRRRTSTEPQRAQQGASAATAPAALDTLSRLQQLADASPQAAQLRRLQALVDASPQVAQLRRLQALADASPQAAQLRRLQALADASPQAAQLRRLQALADVAAGVPSPTDTVEAAPLNRTGLPDGLKAGVESLSGLSMDHVRVHYNSAQPAQLNALAYAQGSDIHVAPGQEQHLPHEAWHVTKQKGRREELAIQFMKSTSSKSKNSKKKFIPIDQFNAEEKSQIEVGFDLDARPDIDRSLISVTIQSSARNHYPSNGGSGSDNYNWLNDDWLTERVKDDIVIICQSGEINENQNIDQEIDVKNEDIENGFTKSNKFIIAYRYSVALNGRIQASTWHCGPSTQAQNRKKNGRTNASK